MSVDYYFNRNISLKEIKENTDIQISLNKDDDICILQKDDDVIRAILHDHITLTPKDDSLCISILKSKGNGLTIISEIALKLQARFITDNEQNVLFNESNKLYKKLEKQIMTKYGFFVGKHGEVAASKEDLMKKYGNSRICKCL